MVETPEKGLLRGRDENLGDLYVVHKLMLAHQATSKDKDEKSKQEQKKLEPGNCVDLRRSHQCTEAHACKSSLFRRKIQLRGLMTSPRKTRVIYRSWWTSIPVRL